MPPIDPREVVNPKRTLDRREQEAGLNAAPATAAPPVVKPSMSQADFSGYGKQLTPEQKLAQQRQLAEMLRNH